MTTTNEITTNTLAGWFGSDRMVAKQYAAALGKCDHVMVPFCGGCSILQFIETRAGVACDLHRHVVNLARVVANDAMVESLIRAVERILLHPDELHHAQERCKARERNSCGFMQAASDDVPTDTPDIAWAADYFVCSWMGRGGFSGKENEFDQGLSIRYGAGGGDSAVRYQSALQSLRGWNKVLCNRWSFSVMHSFDLLGKVKDQRGHGVYVDAPWPDAGDEYRHSFSIVEQRELAKKLASIQQARVVVRFGDHPLIRELYPESHWKISPLESRSQGNNDLAELMIVKGGA